VGFIHLKERDHFEEKEVDWKILFKWILGNIVAVDYINLAPDKRNK
jgi:hypothetical protein